MNTCHSTSIEERPKNIPNERNKLGKYMWGLYICLLVIIFFYHAYLLYLQWRDEEVSTSINPNGSPFIQPDIVICPKRFISKAIANNPPMNANESLTLTIKDLTETIHRLDNWFRNNSIVSNVFIWDTLNLGDIYEVFYPYSEELFLEIICNFKNISNENLKVEMNMVHFACYRLTPLMCNLSSPSKSLEIKFYNHLYGINTAYTKLKVSIRNRPIDSYMFSALEYDDVVEDGLVVYFVQPKELIHRGTKGVPLNPNTHTTIRITSTRYERISTKQNICRKKDPDVQIHNLLRESGYKSSLNYSASSICIYRGIQNELYQDMGCVSSQFPIPAEIPENYTFCGNITEDQAMTSKELYALYFNDFNAMNDNIIDNCSKMTPCRSTVHSTTIIASKWPQKYSFQHIIAHCEDVLRDPQTASNMPGVQEMYNDVKLNPSNAPLWEKNLLKVTIAPGELRSTVVVEYQPYSFKNFFSDAGGIMGFYMGASLLTLGEVFRLVNNLSHRVLRRRKMDEANSLDGNPTG